MNSRMVPGTRAARVGWATGVAAASACAVLGYSALSVRAAGAPADRPLVYSGVLEQRAVPRVLVTRDPRGGCPGLYVAGEDLVTQTFSTHGPATVQASGNIIACTAGRHDLILYVDGIEVDRTLASPNGPGGDFWVGMFVEGVLEVGPGDHTVALRGTASDVYGCGASWGRIQTTLFE